MKVRDRLYKDMIRTKSKLKENLSKSKKIVDLIKICSKWRYQKFLKKIGEIPKPYGMGLIILYILKRAIKLTLHLFLLLERNTITDSEDISEHFNNFFTSMGQEFQKSIKKPFSN